MKRFAALTLVALAGCVITEDEGEEEAASGSPPAAQPAAPSATPPQPATPDTLSQLRLVVDISERKLYVLNGQDTLRMDDVAVGTSKYPTPTGEFTIDRVDWNPDWTPPPGEEWTEDKEPQPPGSPENPMGRARLVFQPPYSIHGTKERASLGKAASHGSIRVANEVVKQLGRMVMEAGGARRPENFYQQVEANRTRMEGVQLPRPVPISIQR